MVRRALNRRIAVVVQVERCRASTSREDPLSFSRHRGEV
jgi:hypothetical protein